MQTKALIASFIMFGVLFNPHANAVAAVTTYTDEAQFIAAAGNPTFESFEQLTARVRSAAPINVPAFTITPSGQTLGVQDTPNSPEGGFGSFATDGSKYLFVYLPNQPTGTLQFDLAQPSTAFGFSITDVGETDGILSLSTNTGEAQSGLVLAQYPPQLGGGASLFFGITQATPFTQVILNVTGIDEAYGLDKVYTQAVPIPSAVWLFISALIGLGGRLFYLRRESV